MKRLFCLILCTVFLVSCAKVSGNPFSAFNGGFSVKISSNCEGNTCDFSYNKKDGTVTFLSPSELVGFTLYENKDGIFISCDGISVPVSEYAGRLLLICKYVFAASSDDAVEISARDTENGVLTLVNTDNCEYAFFGDGTPYSVCGEYEGIHFEFTFFDFEAAQ
jgi:hypothetical protein